MKRILFVPDTHRPYHDKKIWSLFLRAAKAFKPDIIIILGDFADFYCVSSHDKNPNRVKSLRDEVEDVRSGLRELKRLGADRIIYVSGNHEDRLERYLMTKAPELFNSVTIEEVLGLQPLGIEYVPYKRHLKIGKLFVTHELGNAGAYAHYKAQADFEGNAVIGHTHRIGYQVKGNAAGSAHVGAMFGWLGDFDQVDYMHRIKALRDWSHGFGLGYMRPNGVVHLVPVPIVEGCCVVDGKLIT